MHKQKASRMTLRGIILLLSFTGILAAKDPVIYFTYLFNWNLNHAGAPVSGIPMLVEQGHVPLLDLFEKHDRWTTQFYFSGFTSNYLQEHYPQVVDRVKQGNRQGRYEIGAYKYSHLILNLAPYDNIVHQLQAGMAVDRRVWGIKTHSLFLPENAFDVTLPHIMPKVGIEWLALYKEIVPEFADEIFYPPTVIVEGIDDTKATAIFCSHYLERGSVEELKAQLDGLYATLKEKGIEEHFVALKGDAEALYFASRSILNRQQGQAYKAGDRLPELPAMAEMDARLGMIENLPYAQFMTMSEYIKKHPPTETLPAENISLRADFGRWISGGGVERLNILTNEARVEISSATYTIDLAEKLGLDVKEARQLLDQAWEQLMLSEGADGRATNPPASRMIFVATAAVKAKELAQASAQAIKKKKKFGF